MKDSVLCVLRKNKQQFSIFSILPLQKYEVEFLLQQQWYDPRLRYANQSQYEYLNAIHHHEDIWLPDTYFIMHGDFKDPIIPMHFALRIYRNGTINYLMRYNINPCIRLVWFLIWPWPEGAHAQSIFNMWMRWVRTRNSGRAINKIDWLRL